MRNKKLWIFVALAVLVIGIFAFFLLRDYVEQVDGYVIHVYYIGGNDLVSEVRQVDAYKTLQEKMLRAIELMNEPSANTGYEKLFTEELRVLNLWEQQNFMQISFSSEYYLLPVYREILLRTAIVRIAHSLGANGVYFYVEGEPLTNSIGERLGRMTIHNNKFHPDIESHPPIITLENIITYRVHENGLIRETTLLAIDDATSTESQILENVLDDVQILDVVVIENIAYIDLGEELEDELLIYSIVNTLTARENIEEVQFLIEGQSVPDSFFRNETLVLNPL